MPVQCLSQQAFPGTNAILAAALVAVLSGCAHVPMVSKSGFNLALTTTATLNNCGKSTAFPLQYRVLQVSDASPLAGMRLERLWDHEGDMLGGALVWKGPAMSITPGTKRKDEPVAIDPRTKAIVVLGNFCKTNESCFYYVQSVAKKKVDLELTADATCLTPTKR